MVNKSIAMSLIFAYKFLENKCDIFDSTIGQCASTFGYKYSSTEELMGNILEMSDRKKDLINLKLLIDEIIFACSDTSKKLLVLISRTGYDIDEIINIFDVCERTAYRYVKKAMIEFGKRLQSAAIDVPSILSREKWISRLLNAYSVSRDFDLAIS